jgi:hypothetical protein
METFMTIHHTDSQSTPHLDLPYILPAQARKYISINESLTRLDDLVQLSAEAMNFASPPMVPEENSHYIIAENANGLWEGYEGSIAGYSDGGWTYYTPKIGWRVWVKNVQSLRVFDGDTWRAVEHSFDDVSAKQIGLGAKTDLTNRLTVASPASLFTHVGDSHQLKVNRDSKIDKAAVLFQSDFVGQAEIGLLGTDDFQMKMSPDGMTWKSALTIKADTNFVSLGHSSPAAWLDIKSQSVGANLLLLRAEQGGSVLSVAENGSKNLYLHLKDSSGATCVQIHGSGKSFFNGGNVGIGTTAPTAKLHVDGVMRLKTFDPAALPNAANTGAGSIVVTLDSQGNTSLAISDGQNWRMLSAA